ncbi:MAG: putative aminopeptidase [Parasphingorhabdus sp.]|jgi:predicted aminopeptidase
MIRWKFVGLGVIALLLLMQGCATTRYYAQAVKGQVDIIIHSRSIEGLLDHPDTSRDLAARLRKVRSMVEFAGNSLNLPHQGSYKKYADLGREYVVWNVVAAGEFSVSPKTWCFPFAGCLGYRGYFSKIRAKKHAAALRQQGLDVYLYGIDAYSTLGWLNDPILNTFVNYQEAELAGLIFHELTHQKVYIKDDFVFNESLATAVELAGVELWATERETGDDFSAYQRRHQYRSAIVENMLATRSELKELYVSNSTEDEKKRDKESIFARLKQQLHNLAIKYDASTNWLESLPLNNAVLSSYATYFDYVPAFQSLLEQHNLDFESFFSTVEQMEKMTPDKRDAWLRARVR